MVRSVDVIIPVYNRAHCIADVIAQLERQTFRDFRAIFVDDGSSDGSAEVLKELLKS
ncbi:MAG: glycosyltransferase, partial [Clostridia bacterium]|nr:glycosyltransferase [Clostridia bacterium]